MNALAARAGLTRDAIPRDVPPLTLRDAKRFLSKLERVDDHWLWRGGRNERGYGVFYYDGPTKVRENGRTKRLPRWRRYAHRIAYTLFVGPIPPGMEVNHTCPDGYVHCVAPEHLEALTWQEHVGYTLELSEEDEERLGRVNNVPF